MADLARDSRVPTKPSKRSALCSNDSDVQRDFLTFRRSAKSQKTHHATLRGGKGLELRSLLDERCLTFWTAVLRHAIGKHPGETSFRKPRLLHIRRGVPKGHGSLTRALPALGSVRCLWLVLRVRPLAIDWCLENYLKRGLERRHCETVHLASTPMPNGAGSVIRQSAMSGKQSGQAFERWLPESLATAVSSTR